MGTLFGPEEYRALLLSTFAGLSTSIGGAIAIVKRPDDALLALLLGVAFGVMLLLSVAELWIHQALEHGFVSITISVGLGALLYVVAQPFFPTFEGEQALADASSSQAVINALDTSGNDTLPAEHKTARGVHEGHVMHKRQSVAADARSRHIAGDGETPNISLRPSELLRLSFLMALTMTLHNLPEGFAVAFSSYTDFGLIMALAIAVHNIPEGVIVAAPVYAATGCKWRAMAMATMSGLSEPLGALIALLLVKPFITITNLQWLLAFVGGIMGAVCIVELLPEGRKCKQDLRFVQGVTLGALIMGWTLCVGV